MQGLKNRVKETTTTTGTGAVSLGGAPSGYQAFSSTFSNGDDVYYCIEGGAEWEVGLGTYNSSGPTISRDYVIASSNAGAAVSFSAGSKNVFCTVPGERLGHTVISSVTLTTQTEVDFSIPRGASRIVCGYDDWKINGTGVFRVQLIDAGGPETTGYNTNHCLVNSTIVQDSSGWDFTNGSSTNTITGKLTLENFNGNLWQGDGMARYNSASIGLTVGNKTLSEKLTGIRFTNAGGSQMNGGVLSVKYGF